jgi:ABC-2 type transport system permease protein
MIMTSMRVRVRTRPAKLIKIFFRLQLIQLRAAMEYRADFWIGIVGAALQQLVGIVFLITFFSHVPTLGGWTVWNVAVLHGVVMAAAGLVELFADGVWQLRAAVNTGTFDRVLVRPISPAVQQITSLASIHGLGNVGAGVVVLAIGLARSNVEWQLWTVPVLILAILCGCVMSSALNFTVNMIAFWEPSAQSAFPTLVALMRDFAKFPLDIYGTAIRTVITFLLPYAVISYYPSRLVLGIDDPAGWWAVAPVIAATAVGCVAALLWRRGINRYQGVGH